MRRLDSDRPGLVDPARIIDRPVVKFDAWEVGLVWTGNDLEPGQWLHAEAGSVLKRATGPAGRAGAERVSEVQVLWHCGGSLRRAPMLVGDKPFFGFHRARQRAGKDFLNVRRAEKGCGRYEKK